MPATKMQPRPIPAAYKKAVSSGADATREFRAAAAPAVVTEIEMPDEGDFSLKDILALPEMESGTASETFTARGRAWRITIKTDGMTGADSFFALAEAMERGKQQSSLTVITPPPK